MCVGGFYNREAIPMSCPATAGSMKVTLTMKQKDR